MLISSRRYRSGFSSGSFHPKSWDPSYKDPEKGHPTFGKPLLTSVACLPQRSAKDGRCWAEAKGTFLMSREYSMPPMAQQLGHKKQLNTLRTFFWVQAVTQLQGSNPFDTDLQDCIEQLDWFPQLVSDRCPCNQRLIHQKSNQISMFHSLASFLHSRTKPEAARALSWGTCRPTSNILKPCLSTNQGAMIPDISSEKTLSPWLLLVRRTLKPCLLDGSHAHSDCEIQGSPVHICTYMHIHVHICTCGYIDVHVCTYIYTCICM